MIFIAIFFEYFLAFILKCNKIYCIIYEILFYIINFKIKIFIFLKGCVFINLYNFLNSLDNTLEKNIKSYENSLADNFITELKNFLFINNSLEKLKTFPEGTLFTLDRFEGDFAICENRTTGEMFDIPFILVDSSAKAGDILRFNGDKLQVNYEETNRQQLLIEKLFKDSFKK